MTCVSLFSGSSGNCVFVREENTRILIDAGVSARSIARALQSLSVELSELDGIFLTHEHSDHIGGVATLLKHTTLPLFLAPECAAALYETYAARSQPLAALFAERVRTVEPGKSYDCGALILSPFALPHDSAACLGVVIGSEHAEKTLGVATDLGMMTVDARRALAGCENVILESNHDPQMLSEGPYPPYLQARIRSERGHLSNPDSAAFLQTLAEQGTRRALLFHLSRENNTPAIARSCAEQALAELGALPGDCTLGVACPDAPTPLF